MTITTTVTTRTTTARTAVKFNQLDTVLVSLISTYDKTRTIFLNRNKLLINISINNVNSCNNVMLLVVGRVTNSNNMYLGCVMLHVYKYL